MSNNPSWKVRAISVPGPDTDLSLFVAFDDARFLFGAGEGTQRAFAQKKQSFRGLQAVFTPGGAQGRGGLPGVLMTVADAGIKHLALAGGPDLTHYLSTLRGSVVRDGLSIEVPNFSLDSSEASQVVFSSPRMTVYGVALRSPAPERMIIAEPERPSQLSPTELQQWTSAVTQDMFRGERATPVQHASKRWPNMTRVSYPDDRFPLPLADNEVSTDMVYICRTPDLRGKFDVAKAEALKVPYGPIRGKLVKGENIEFEDPEAPGGKRIVKPEECLVGGGPGSILIVVNCRVENLPKLLTSTAFAPYQSDVGAPECFVHCIVHRVPREIWDNPTYRSWMQMFGPKTQHLLADASGTNQIFFNSATWNTLKLHMLDPEIFPVLDHSTPMDYSPPTLPPNSSLLVPNSIISMHPPKPAEVLPTLEKDKQFPTDATAITDTLQRLRKESAEYAAAVDAARAAVADEAVKRATIEKVPGDDIVVTTLGTGSAIPSKYRNGSSPQKAKLTPVSSTHLDIPDVGGVLLDCGEGTLGQMRRRWGPNLKQVYSDLRMIFISHMHADHHLGLTAILEDRFKHGIHTPLYLVAPFPIALQLQETAFWQAGVPREALENVRYVSTNRLRRGWRPRRSSSLSSPTRAGSMDPGTSEQSASPADSDADIPLASVVVEEAALQDVAAGVRQWPFQNVSRFHPDCNERARDTMFTLIEDLGLDEIIVPQVAHRGAAWGLVLTHKSGWKVAYSGDTKPCDAFVQAAFGSTILIHEATLEDEKPDVAHAKGHSTFSQAIEVGWAMGARYVILNHFSQRYPKIPKLPVSADEKSGPDVAISFDFMSLRARDTWKMAHYMKPLEILYAEEEAEEELEDEEAVEEREENGPKAQRGRAAKQPKGSRQGEKRSSTASPGDAGAKKVRVSGA